MVGKDKDYGKKKRAFLSILIKIGHRFPGRRNTEIIPKQKNSIRNSEVF